MVYTLNIQSRIYHPASLSVYVYLFALAVYSFYRPAVRTLRHYSVGGFIRYMAVVLSLSVYRMYLARLGW
jgi:hypothetical protein